MRAQDALAEVLPGGGLAAALLRPAGAQVVAGGGLTACGFETPQGEAFGSFMAALQQDVRAISDGAALPLAEAAETMRKGVIEGRLAADLPDGARAFMLYALYGVRRAAETQEALAAELAATPEFQSVPPEQVWRMLIDQAAWGDGRHAGLRFENEPGYLGGMYNGLDAMLRAHRERRPLDADLFRDLHDASTSGVMAGRLTVLPNDRNEIQVAARRTEPGEIAPEASSGHDGGFDGRMTRGFRQAHVQVSFNLIAQRTVSKAGRVDFFAHQDRHPPAEQAWLAMKPYGGKWRRLRSADAWNGTSPLKVDPPEMAPAQSAAKVQAILDDARQGLAGTTTEPQKLEEIARCVQRLEQAHVFEDGNARTTGILVLNKLLLEQGLGPAMVADPNRFDCLSIQELVQDIRQGQAAFSALAGQPRQSLPPSGLGMSSPHAPQ